jgi:NTP pyrophosphatase (non-canonical NTP hydrolase)
MAFNELQIEVSEYDRRFGWVGDSPENVVLHMQEELGEISREILKIKKYKNQPPSLDGLGDEISDLLYLSLKLANISGLKIDDSWKKIAGRYSEK